MIRQCRIALPLFVLLVAGCASAAKRPIQASAPPSIPASPRAALSPAPPALAKIQLASVKIRENVVAIWSVEGKSGCMFTAGMTIDADGAPNAYDPENKRGLDFLGNAGHKGNWWALATDNGQPSGKPLVQSSGEFKGFYIAQTSLRDSTKSDADIAKYVDSRRVPFIALPKRLLDLGTIRIGDLAVVYNTLNGKIEYAIVADEGPNDSIGEGSIALAGSLGIGANMRAKTAGQASGVVYLIFPKTAANPLWPRTPLDIHDKAAAAFQEWGGLSQLKIVVGR